MLLPGRTTTYPDPVAFPPMRLDRTPLMPFQTQNPDNPPRECSHRHHASSIPFRTEPCRFVNKGDMTMTDAVDRYRTFLRRRGLAQSTIERRTNALAMLAETCDLLTADHHAIEQFLDARRGRSGGGLDARTRTCWISHLHNFFQWAVAEEILAVDPTVRLVRPKLRRKLPRPTPEADFQRALDAAPTETLRTWLLLAGNQGLRCAEIAGLTGENVTSTTMRVRGKGQKDRVLPLHPKVAVLVPAWPASGPVFRDPATGGPYTAQQVSRHLGNLFRSLRMPYRAHQARHRFATAVYEATGDIAVVAELCGHESIETTRVYTQVSASRLAAAVARIA